SIAMGIVPSGGAIGWFLSTLLLSMFLATLSVMTLLQTKPHLKIELTSAPLLLAVTVLLQSFVEEVLFRVYLMNKIFRRFFNSEILLCFCSAAFFSLAHLLNYRMSEGVSLSPAPLLFLFLIGFAGSGLYLRQGHILGAWGFHAGWNAVRFAVVLLSDGNRVAESMTFELLEGSWLCLGLSGGLVALSLIHQRRRTRP
ncbi:CPBP family intramembrane metalloprotease, partial [bacterium]|nr:CPBP family intramembrane metalloprotease [bacterium]